MRKSRIYQNWLQTIKFISILVLFFSGFLLSKEKLAPSIVLLVLNLVFGYFCSELKYRRYLTIIKEYRKSKIPVLNHSKFYQFWLQISGRGREMLVFFTGLLLGQGYIYISFILLFIQLTNGLITSELIYRREQAVLIDKYLKKNKERDVQYNQSAC